MMIMAVLHSNTSATSLTNYNISQKTDVSSCIISLSVATLGIFLFMYSFTLKNHYMTVCLILMAVGVCISVYGLFRCLSNSDKNMYKLEGEGIKEYHLYFGQYRKETLQAIINADGIPEGIKPSGHYEGVIRLDIILSEDDRFAGLQLMEYDTCTFHPVTDMHYHTGTDVERLKSLLDSYHTV